MENSVERGMKRERRLSATTSLCNTWNIDSLERRPPAMTTLCNEVPLEQRPLATVVWIQGTRDRLTNATEAPSDHAILHEDGAIARVQIVS